jgi:hypothetical protein
MAKGKKDLKRVYLGTLADDRQELQTKLPGN